MTNTSIIITETPNGSGFVKKAYRCNDETDFIARISQLAIRSDDEIETVEDAIDYLDSRYAQRTAIVTRADFDSLTTDSWDTVVLEQAEALGWYEVPAEDGDDE